MYNLFVEEVLKKTARFIDDNVTARKIAIGVSGGRDSMCLLHAVINCGRVDKENVIAVHVNHCLRDTADRDEQFVREFCAKNSIEFRSFRVDVNKKSRNDGLTVEQAARELRYGIFYDLLKSGAAEVVFTAHHALDNVESVLMHMFRGAGIDGLSRMDECSGIRINGRTLTAIGRPFLEVYPQELDEYAKENGIEYVTDETNLELGADRNYVRLKVIPTIEERYSGAVKAINALSKECVELKRLLDDSLDLSQLKHDCGAVVISNTALKGPLAERYVRHALKSFTLTDMSRTDIDNVIAAADWKMGGSVELRHGVTAMREYDGVALYVPQSVKHFDGEIPVVIGDNYIDGIAVDIKRSNRAPRSVKGGAVDYKKLDGAVLRFRRDGDVFKPFGSGGTKKLKEYFIDKKIPLRLRGRIPLICRGREVLVIVGYEISDGVKQTEETTEKCVIKVRY